MDIAPKWLVIVISVIIASIVGKFLFIVFSGVSFYKVEFRESDDNSDQWFIAQYDIGRTNGGAILGYFDNTDNKSEEEFRLILYNQTRKSQISEFLKWHNSDEKLISGSFDLKYNDAFKPLIVHFTSLAKL